MKSASNFLQRISNKMGFITFWLHQMSPLVNGYFLPATTS